MILYGVIAMFFCFLGVASWDPFIMFNAGLSLSLTWQTYRRLSRFQNDMPLLIEERNSWKEYGLKGKDSA